MFDWNDLRSFLAVAESGSTLSAGRALRVSQTTVARRVTALEQALGITLFERRPAGYVLTAMGEQLLGQAKEVEAAALALEEAASAQAREVGGTVRLTTQEIFAVTVLPDILRDLHEAYPTVKIELDMSDEVRDLAAGGADIALRSSKSVSGAGLVGRRVADDHWSFYCSRSYAAEHGCPRKPRELRDHPIIGGGGKQVAQVYDAWLRDNDLQDAVVMQHGSPTGLLSAVRAGLGLAALPGFIADLDPELMRCMPPAPENQMGLWLLTHERLRHTPRVRIVLDFLGDRLTRLARLIRDRHEADAAPAGQVQST